jgi:hypothetical protein
MNGEQEDQARYNIITVPAGQTNINTGIVIGLIPGAWTWVNVQVITSAGYGPKSEDYPMETGNYGRIFFLSSSLFKLKCSEACAHIHYFVCLNMLARRQAFCLFEYACL